MPFDWFAAKLAGACVIIFVLQLVLPWLIDEFALVSKEAMQKPWMFLSSIFLHGGFEHLLYNMFALVLFGSILEKIIGGRNFLAIFFVSGLMASFGSFLFYEASLGASGAIFGLSGALAVLRPKMTVWVAGVPMPMIFAIIIWAAGDFLGLFMPSGIANAAHLTGLFVGILLGLKLRKQYGLKQTARKDIDRILNDNEIRKWEDEWM